MAAPTEGLDDYRRACLTEAIKSVWSRMGTSMTISDVVEYLHNQPDQRYLFWLETRQFLGRQQ